MTRLALVGYGRIAPKHLEVFRAQGAEFVGCCNRSPEGRHKAETEGGIPRSYERIDEMLDRERPDGVICCASMHHIHGVALEILPRGIPTFLEKPPGTSLVEYARLCELAQRHRTPVMIGLNRRHYSVVRKAVEDAGGFDKITAVAVEWSEDPRHFLARGFDVDQVSRMVFGNTLHGLDLLTFLAGEVDEPAVVGLDLGEPLRWMMALEGVSRQGALVTFNSTWDSPGRWRVSFCSPGRRYVFAPLESCEVSESGVKQPRFIEPDENDGKYKPGFFHQAEQFLCAIATRQVNPRYDLASAGPAMQLADRLTAACRGASRGSLAVAPTSIPLRDQSACQPASLGATRPRPLRVVAIADSLAMARDEPPIRWTETWPVRLFEELRASGIDAEVINCGQRARTAEGLLAAEFEEHVVLKQPDVIVVQIGIVDCAPRIFSRRERALLNQSIVPASWRDWIVRRRSSRRERILRNAPRLAKVYTPPKRFAACLEMFGKKLAQLETRPRLIVLPIVCDPVAMDEKSPGHHENVKEYNMLLRTFARTARADWFEPDELIPPDEVRRSFASDGYHFNAFGSSRCGERLAARIVGLQEPCDQKQRDGVARQVS